MGLLEPLNPWPEQTMGGHTQTYTHTADAVEEGVGNGAWGTAQICCARLTYQ